VNFWEGWPLPEEQSIRFWGDLDSRIFVHGRLRGLLCDLSTFVRWRHQTFVVSRRYMLSLDAVLLKGSGFSDAVAKAVKWPTVQRQE